VAALCMILVAATGFLLAFKKEAGLQPPTRNAGEIARWLPVDSLIDYASRHAARENRLVNPRVDRIDLRPTEGIAKIFFKNSFLEIQLHGQTGEVLSSSTRYDDLVEKIHDGSVFDFVFETKRPAFTWLYSGFTGISLLVLAVTGIFLWVNPRVIRNLKKKYHGEQSLTDSKDH
jgi:uncharacterized iron-regulated membrane protein